MAFRKGPSVSYGKRDFLFLILVPAKNSSDVWCISLDVRRHDQNIFRCQTWDRLKEIKKVIVEDLYLPHGAVTGVNLDRPVSRINGNFLLSPPYRQIQNI